MRITNNANIFVKRKKNHSSFYYRYCLRTGAIFLGVKTVFITPKSQTAENRFQKNNSFIQQNSKNTEFWMVTTLHYVSLPAHKIMNFILATATQMLHFSFLFSGSAYFDLMQRNMHQLTSMLNKVQIPLLTSSLHQIFFPSNFHPVFFFFIFLFFSILFFLFLPVFFRHYYYFRIHFLLSTSLSFSFFNRENTFH